MGGHFTPQISRSCHHSASPPHPHQAVRSAEGVQEAMDVCMGGQGAAGTSCNDPVVSLAVTVEVKWLDAGHAPRHKANPGQLIRHGQPC